MKKNRKQADLAGALRTMLFMTAVTGYVEAVQAERQTKEFHEREAKRIQNMNESHAFRNVCIGVIVLFILIRFFL